MNNILEIQPTWCREPLPEKKFEWNDWQLAHPARAKKWEKVMLFDPTDIYNRIAEHIDPNKRTQSIRSHIMYPDSKDGTCACGCGVKLEGRRTRWASDLCRIVYTDIGYIIANLYRRPSFYMDLYYGKKCVKCDRNEREVKLFLDHIIPVKHGGGGCWLSNYQWLCHDCHVLKTNEDFGHKTANKNQTKLEL